MGKERILVVDDEEGIAGLCGKIGRSASTRVTVILPSGRVAGDTDEDSGPWDRHRQRAYSSLV